MSKKANCQTSRRLVKIILDLWSILAVLLFIADFFTGNRFNSATSAIGIIYLALLGIYVSEKEYSRWKSDFISCYIGEWYVVLWTVVMMLFAILAPFSNGQFKIPGEFAIIYSSIVGTFAITQHSKFLKNRK